MGKYSEIKIGAKIDYIEVDGAKFNKFIADFQKQISAGIGKAFSTISDAQAPIKEIDKQFANMAKYSKLIAEFLGHKNVEANKKNVEAIAKAYAAIETINKQLLNNKISFKQALNEAKKLRLTLLPLGSEVVQQFNDDVVKGFTRTAAKAADNFSKEFESKKSKLRTILQQTISEIDKVLATKGPDSVSASARKMLEARKQRAVTALSGLDENNKTVKQLEALIRVRQKSLESIQKERKAFEAQTQEIIKNRKERERLEAAESQAKVAKKIADREATVIGPVRKRAAAEAEAIRLEKERNKIIDERIKKLQKENREYVRNKNVVRDPTKTIADREATVIGPVRKRAAMARELEKTSVAAVKATKSTNRLTKAIYNAGFSMELFGRKTGLAFTRYGAFLAGSFGIYRLIGYIRSATDEALKFEAIMTKLEQVLESNQDALKPLGNEIRNLAKITGVSTEDIGKGVFLFAQSGVKNIDELKILAESLARIPLSATFGDIDETAQGLLAVFGQFNKEVTETGRILDLINKFAGDFAIESRDIFEIIKRGGATVSAAKIEFEDFLGLASLLRESTRESASTIGTFFKTGIARILQPSSQKALKALGVTANDTFGQLQQLAKVFGEMDNPLDKVQLAQDLVGVRQISRLIALMRELNDPEGVRRVRETIGGAKGSFTEQTSKRLDDISTSINRIRRSFEDMIIAVAENQNLKRFISNIADLTEKFSGLGSVISFISPSLIGIIALLARKPLAEFGRGLAKHFRGDTSLAKKSAPLFPPSFTFREKVNRGKRLFGIQRSKGFSPLLRGAGGIAGVGGLTLGTILQQFGDSTSVRIGNAITQGAGMGLLVGMINPLAGAITGVVAGLVELQRSSLELAAIERERAFEKTPTASRLFANLLDRRQSGQAGFNFGDINRRNISSWFQRLAFGPTDSTTKWQLRRGQVINEIQESIIKNDEIGKGFTYLAEKVFRETLDNIRTQSFETEKERNRAFDKQFKANFAQELERGGFKFTFTEMASILSTINNWKLPEFIEPVAGDPIQDFFENADKLALIISNISLVLRDFGLDVERANDSLKTIVTDVMSLQQITVPTNQQDFLRKFGFNRLANFVENNRQLDSIAIDFAKEFQEAARSFFQLGQGNEADNAIQYNAEKFLQSLAGIPSENIDAGSQAILDNLIEKYADFLRIVSAEIDKTMPDTVKTIIDAVKSGESLSEQVFGPLNKQIKNIIETYKKEIELKNQELKLRFKLEQNILSINSTINRFNSNITKMKDGIQDLDTEINDFINNTDNITKLRNRGERLLGRSRRTRFTQPLDDFIKEVTEASKNRIDSILKIQEDNRRNIFKDDAFKNLDDNLDSQVKFLELQSKVNERLAELDDRIRNASEAARLFKQAFDEANNQLRSTGGSLTGFNVDQISEGLSAFNKFIGISKLTGPDVGRISGIRKAGAGLEALTRQEFDALSRILQTAGSFNLGGGLSGADILGEAQRAIALPFLAQLRGQITGETREQAAQAILKEIADAESAAKKALEEEKKLRQDQIKLIELQKKLANDEKQFYIDQKRILTDLLKGFNIKEDLSIIKDKIDKFFGDIPQKVSVVNDNNGVNTVNNNNEISNAITSQTLALSDNLLTLNENIIGIANQLTKILSDESSIVTKLEVSPMQINVSINAPDIVATIGPTIKQSIMSEIGIKLSEIFKDDPEKSGALRGI